MAAEYFSFEDVLGELDVPEEELKRMVSEGELRAFRDENKMKFRKEDVESLRKGRMTEPTLILPAQDEGGGGSGETVLDLDSGIQELPADDAGPAIDVGAAPAAKGGKSAPPEGATEQLDFSDTDITVADDSPPATQEGEATEAVLETDETGMSTEPLQLVEEGTTEPIATEEAAQTEEMPAAEEGPKKKPRARKTVAIPLEMEEEIERKKPHWVWSTLLVATFLVALYAGFFHFELQRIEAGLAEKPTGITEGMTRWISEKHYASEKWRPYLSFEGVSPNTVPEPFQRKAAWLFTSEDREQIKAVPIYGPDASMRKGAPPAEAAPAGGEAPKPEEGGAKPAAEGGEAKPAAEGTQVEGMEKAGEAK